MARRRAATGATGEGVTGLFDRTVETWRQLGAPPSLYEVAAAVAAHRRCARPAFRRDFVYAQPLDALRDRPPADSPLTNQAAARLVASEWWRSTRAYFLRRREALTDEEQARTDRCPRLHQPSGQMYDLAALEEELFGGDRGQAA